MNNCLGKSCSFGLLCASIEGVCQILCEPSFPFDIEGRMWNVIVLIPDHCRSIYFGSSKTYLSFPNPSYLLLTVLRWYFCCFSSVLHVGVYIVPLCFLFVRIFSLKRRCACFYLTVFPILVMAF